MINTTKLIKETLQMLIFNVSMIKMQPKTKKRNQNFNNLISQTENNEVIYHTVSYFQAYWNEV